MLKITELYKLEGLKMPSELEEVYKGMLEFVRDFGTELQDDDADESLRILSEFYDKNSNNDSLHKLFQSENEQKIARMFINQRVKNEQITTSYILKVGAMLGIKYHHCYLIKNKLVESGLIPESWICNFKRNLGGRPKKTI